MGYLNGKIPDPKVPDPKYSKWDVKKSTIRSWLLNVMQPDINQDLLFLHSVKEIWRHLMKHIRTRELRLQYMTRSDEFKEPTRVIGLWQLTTISYGAYGRR